MLIRSGVDAAAFNQLLSAGLEHAVDGATLQKVAKPGLNSGHHFETLSPIIGIERE